MKKRVALTTLSLALSVLPLCAQMTTEAGMQGSVVFPQDDLRSAVGGRAGFNFGFHYSIDLQGGNELRPRIDFTRIDGGSFSASSLTSTTTVQGIGIGVDYLRYLEGRNRGLYGVAGLDLVWWNSDYRFGGSERKTAPSLMVGAGHRFNSAWSMEFTMDFSQFRASAGTASTLRAGALYKF